ncbi:MAG: hypothetical protein Q8M94_20980 [Ignavibacteria bacterium]|nr:hypothetical protein [Ignavibacteria bacterium]
MGRSPHAIIVAFLAMMKKGHTHHCKPYMTTLLERIAKYQDVHIKRSRGHECTHEIEAKGYMKRRRRWTRDPETGIRSKSSVWTFTMYGAQYCINKGMDYAKVLLAAMIEWRKRHDGRFPGPKDIFPGEEGMDEAKALDRLQWYYKDIVNWPAGGNTPATT